MATNNTSDDGRELPPPELPPLQPSNKRQKTDEGSVLFTNEEMMMQQQLQAMFALQRKNGLPENNIPENPPPNTTAKIKDTNVGGAKSLGMSRSAAEAACGKRKREFKNSKGRAISRSKHQKSEEKPTSTKYRLNKTKTSFARLCGHEGCSNQVVNGGVCMRHGAKVKRCSQEGCTSIVSRVECVKDTERIRWHS